MQRSSLEGYRSAFSAGREKTKKKNTKGTITLGDYVLVCASNRVFFSGLKSLKGRGQIHLLADKAAGLKGCMKPNISLAPSVTALRLCVCVHVSYRQQVQAVLIQVLHHGRQVATLPLGEGVFVVRQVLHVGPNVIVWSSQSPEKTMRTIRCQPALPHKKWKTKRILVDLTTALKSIILEDLKDAAK